MLLAERAVGLDWTKTDLNELHEACHVARAKGDRSRLDRMFTRIIDEEPAYDL